jgi:hypothetical protein
MGETNSNNASGMIDKYSGGSENPKDHSTVSLAANFPDERGIRTAKKRLAINCVGNMGNNGAPDSAMNFFDDCDTMNNIAGANDNARIFLYDASPFLMRIIGNDTVIFSTIFNNNYLSDYGFRPTKGLTLDSSNSAYQYAYTGQYRTPDTLIGVESWYWAPLDPDSSDFIIQKIQVENKSGTKIENLYVGQFMDWDIPSDSGVENGSDYDASRNLIYMFGAEYGPDTGIFAEGSNGNDCILADQRLGGLSFYKGFKFPASSSGDTFTTFAGALTLNYYDWVVPYGNFVPGQLWKKLEGFSGYECWQSTHPEMEDSLYQDLTMVTVYGKFNLESYQLLGFIKILATGNSGVEDLKATIDKAKQWIANHSGFVEHFGCCIVGGDANHDGKLSLLDVSRFLNRIYLYLGNDFFCRDEADANSDGKLNLSDVSYLINYLYRHGPAPRCPY